MTRQRQLASAVALLTLGALSGCQASEQPLSGSRPPVLRPAAEPQEVETWRIGAFGWQRGYLRPGYTGNGNMLSAGLPARGGGPVDKTHVPYGLAEGQDIGTPSADPILRVITDPETDRTQLYVPAEPR